MWVKEEKWGELYRCDEVWPYLVPVFTVRGDGGTLCEFGRVMVWAHSEELNEGKGEGSYVNDSGALCCVCRAAHGKNDQCANEDRCLSVIPYFGEYV